MPDDKLSSEDSETEGQHRHRPTQQEKKRGINYESPKLQDKQKHQRGRPEKANASIPAQNISTNNPVTKKEERGRKNVLNLPKGKPNDESEVKQGKRNVQKNPGYSVPTKTTKKLFNNSNSSPARKMIKNTDLDGETYFK